MNNYELFENLKHKIIEQLIQDNKLVLSNGKYKLKTNINYIISNYNCKEILELCKDKNELKYCIINNDNPYDHNCPTPSLRFMISTALVVDS